MSEVKTIDSLMRYLREEHSINIHGSNQKRKLRNIGYYHGYKGYRFIKTPSNPINFSDFNQIDSLNKFDRDLKALIYPKIMFLETALKNYVLEIVLDESKTNSFSIIYDKILTNYKKYPIGSKKYYSAFKKRLRVRDQIYNTLTRDFNNDKQIVQHFYHKDMQVPIWGIFEALTLGDFGNFVSCLSESAKKKISKELKLNQPCDSDGSLTEKIIYLLKDLRNSVAHNNVIFDCRFKSSSVSKSLVKSLELDTNIELISFDTIVDYIILIVYLLKNLEVSKTDLNKFVTSFEDTVGSFRSSMPTSIFNKIIYPNTHNKILRLKTFIKE